MKKLERDLEGTHRPRVAVIAPTAVNEALLLTIVSIVVAGVERPVFQESKGQAGIPIKVIVGNSSYDWCPKVPLMLGVKKFHSFFVQA